MKNFLLVSFLSVLFFIIPIFVFAVATISPAIPGMTTAVTTSTSPGQFVSGFYSFALMIGGVLAFGAIVYGGVLYAVSGLGNPSGESEGKAWVQSALIGLLLLAGAYLILYTINPNLVNLTLPTLQAVNIQTPAVVDTAVVDNIKNGCLDNRGVMCGSVCCLISNSVCATAKASGGAGPLMCQPK